MSLGNLCQLDYFYDRCCFYENSAPLEKFRVHELAPVQVAFQATELYVAVLSVTQGKRVTDYRQLLSICKLGSK